MTTTYTQADATRQTHAYKTARTRYRTQCANQSAPCWLCHNPIDYTLPNPHPDSWSLDHALTVKDAPHLVSDPHNFRPSHLACNQQRGTDEPRIDIGTPSEVW